MDEPEGLIVNWNRDTEKNFKGKEINIECLDSRSSSSTQVKIIENCKNDNPMAGFLTDFFDEQDVYVLNN